MWVPQNLKWGSGLVGVGVTGSLSTTIRMKTVLRFSGGAAHKTLRRISEEHPQDESQRITTASVIEIQSLLDYTYKMDDVSRVYQAKQTPYEAALFFLSKKESLALCFEVNTADTLRDVRHKVTEELMDDQELASAWVFLKDGKYPISRNEESSMLALDLSSHRIMGDSKRIVTLYAQNAIGITKENVSPVAIDPQGLDDDSGNRSTRKPAKIGVSSVGKKRSVASGGKEGVLSSCNLNSATQCILARMRSSKDVWL